MTTEEAMDMVRSTEHFARPGATTVSGDRFETMYETRSYGSYYFGNLIDLPFEPRSPSDFKALVLEHRRRFAWRPLPKRVERAPASDPPAVVRWCAPLGAGPAPSPFGVDERIALACDVPFGSVDASTVCEIEAGDEVSWQTIVTARWRENPEFGDFIPWMAAQQRTAMREGRARWFVVRDEEDDIAAHAGLFRHGDVVRYADVGTLKAKRGRGFATRLIPGILAHAAAAPHGHVASHLRAVIVADAGSQAERIYRKAGFEPICLERSIVVDAEYAL